MTLDEAVNISRGQIMQILECYGKGFGIYTESNKEVLKGIKDTC